MQKTEMSLADIQAVSLDLLVEFDSFCRANSLKYSLAYGTLIGAVRHKGFIPWDDDVDVVMPRPDYERLCKLYKESEGFKLFYPGDGQCMLSYARLCDMSRTVVDSKAPWILEQAGVWIDIFPIDAAPDSAKATECCYKRMQKRYRRLLRTRKHIGCHGLEKILYPCACEETARLRALRYDNHSKKLPYGSTKRLFNWAAPLWKTAVSYSSDILDEMTEVEFCGHSFLAVKDWNQALSNQYGDYMQLPPVEQRVSTHKAHTYYWE